MHQSPLTLDSFGNAAERLQRALASLRDGGGVLVVDDADRENEGDLIFSASQISVPQMAMLIRHCSGIVCLPLTAEHARRLDLPLMTAHNTNTQQTAFTISIEAATGVTTGVSAADRVATVRAAAGPQARPEDLRRPGHVPLAGPSRWGTGAAGAYRGHRGPHAHGRAGALRRAL